MNKDKILITGACGQLGTELSAALIKIYGESQIITSDLRNTFEDNIQFESLDVTDGKRLAEIIDKHKITQLYHLAAILSARGEQDPHLAWKINMDSTLNILEIAREKKIAKIYYPSSIAAFGQNTPKEQTPQDTIMQPSTVYGISKLCGELWGKYYFEKYGTDVRSLRYPGLISYKTLPGGGTTDYAVDIFHKAIEEGKYQCFLSENTYLPMMYMPDAIKATLDLMEAESATIKNRTSYNLGAMSFSPSEIAKAIQKHIPNFTISYLPDFRQAIADSWPSSIDDQEARKDWGWKPDYDLEKMTEDMLKNLKEIKANLVAH